MRASQGPPHQSDSLSNSQEPKSGGGQPDAQFAKQLSDALEAKEMAVAQASMLRSCLEDTEELLEESRASMNHLETKIASIEAAKPQEDGELELLRIRAEALKQNWRLLFSKLRRQSPRHGGLKLTHKRSRLR